MTSVSTFLESTRAIVVATVLLAGTFSSPAWAEVTTPVLVINEEAATSPITVQPVRGNISVLMGSGGNIGVYAVPNGKLMVDAGIAVSQARVAAALDSLGPGPLKYLINTHYHWDHTDGNPWVHERGAVVIAHENTLKRLISGTRVIDWGYHFPPLDKAGLPTVTVGSEKTMAFEGETILIRYYGPGHTDSDLTVYFKSADVLQVGDIWWNGHYPFIDYSAGGDIDGVIHEVAECIKASTDKTIIIPGHGPVSNRAELMEFHRMLTTIRNNVAALKKQGKTLSETVAAKPTAAFDAKFGTFLIDPAFFTQLVYTGV